MLLAGSRVYSTKVRGSCSTDNPWPVHPAPRAVAALKGPGQKPPAAQRPLKPSGHRREPGEGHQGPSECPGARRGAVDVQICVKDSNRSHPHGAQPHDSKVLAHAVWGAGGPLLQIWTPTGRSPQEARCSRSTGHRDQRAAASGTTKPARGTPGCTARPVHHPGPADRRLRPAGAPVDGAGTVRVAKDSQGSDLPAPRRAGKALPASPPAQRAPSRRRPGDWAARSASPPAHRAPTCQRPAMESSVGHVSRPGVARPARVSEAMTLKHLRSEETRQTPSFCPGVTRPRAVRRPTRGCSRHEPCGVNTTY